MLKLFLDKLGLVSGEFVVGEFDGEEEFIECV